MQFLKRAKELNKHSTKINETQRRVIPLPVYQDGKNMKRLATANGGEEVKRWNSHPLLLGYKMVKLLLKTDNFI